jgi:hypothetical protein
VAEAWNIYSKSTILLPSTSPFTMGNSTALSLLFQSSHLHSPEHENTKHGMIERVLLFVVHQISGANEIENNKLKSAVRMHRFLCCFQAVNCKAISKWKLYFGCEARKGERETDVKETKMRRAEPGHRKPVTPSPRFDYHHDDASDRCNLSTSSLL